MKVRYGHVFGDEVTDLSIELHFYRVADDVEARIGHLVRAWKVAFPEVMPGGGVGYVWSGWTERRVRAWCEGRYQTWWGPSASGKTTDAAILCLLHWLSAPDRTTIHLTSTTAKMLKRRIWGEIVKYYKLWGDGVFPGALKVAENAIVFSEGNIKAGIFGHAVKGGPVEEAVSNIVGIHNEFNVLVVDEMQGTPPAICAGNVISNLSIGKEFKFLGMGNPMSRLDLLGEWSEPVAGWGSVSTETESWETKRGRTHYFDGLKSPGVVDPEKYSFMLKQSEIDETLKHDGEGSPTWWTMRRGFVPPDGLLPTMMTEGMLVEGHAFEKVIWASVPEVVLGVDPAYSAQGDKCMVYPWKVGLDKDGQLRIEGMTPRQVMLKLARDTPMLTFIRTEVVRIASELGLDCDSIAMDCTSMQGTVADAVEETLPGKIYRVYFGGKALDEYMVSALDSRSGTQAYRNRATQLMGHFTQYVKSGSVRGLDREAANQICIRQLAENQYPMRIEGKDDYKSRYGYSPDLGDSVLIAMALIRERKGIMPGGKHAQRVGEEQSMLQKDVDGWEDNWLSS